jgi:hypothetical protein
MATILKNSTDHEDLNGIYQFFLEKVEIEKQCKLRK